MKGTAAKTMIRDGNPEARVMVIGEAPGAEEDRRGLPFVGPAGRLLDRMLAAIDLDRETVLITNIVFWRPPGNRNPTTEEIALCLPFARRQIELVSGEKGRVKRFSITGLTPAGLKAKITRLLAG